MAIFARGKNFVYESEKGWSFDGNYIPHFVELNWYFGDAPINYHGVQKVRVHGLAKGLAKVQVRMAGMQTEYDSDYMQPQYIDMPAKQGYVLPDFAPTTSTADYSVRGISIQMKFEGRNLDITLPEPSHVIQVLVTQSTPVSSGFRAN